MVNDYYDYFRLMAIFPGEPGSDSSPRVLLHLFWKNTSGYWWNEVPVGWLKRKQK